MTPCIQENTTQKYVPTTYSMQQESFDGEYLGQLKDGVPSVENHFATYFGALLSIKLRRQIRSPQLVEDIRQETLIRVLEAIRRKGGVRCPERLGAFVLGVCRHVLFEFLRVETRYSRPNEHSPDPADTRIDPDAPLVNEERKRQVECVLRELSERDQRLLRMIFFEELDRPEACRRLGVSGDYLRVILCRARSRFKEKLSSTDSQAVTFRRRAAAPRYSQRAS